MWKVGFTSVILASTGWTQVTQRVSVATAGAQANVYSGVSSISADGRFVAFESFASNLVASDTNVKWDVFVRDRQLGTTELVSVAAGGAQANGNSQSPSISADGRYVAFMSEASNLIAGPPSNLYPSIFVRDRQAGTTQLVSPGMGGSFADGDSEFPSISGDGRAVAFSSYATNLVPGDTNTLGDVFVYDRSSGSLARVSVATDGAQATGASGQPSISSDGRYVAFDSSATNLVTGDTNGFEDIFVRDRQLGTTEIVSLTLGGALGNGDCLVPSISADGRFVAFESGASNLVAGDTNGLYDVFVRDRQAGTTELVSVDAGGTVGNSSSFGSAISSDGRCVAFLSYATNLVPGDSNGHTDDFLRDRQSGTTERVSLATWGAQGDADSTAYIWPALSGDGRYVAFTSFASNLVAGDTNGVEDVFVRDRFGSPSFTSLCDAGVGGVIACPCSNAPAGLGQGCNNSAATGGATLSAAGGTYLSSDSLVFTTNGEKPTALSVLLQGTSSVSSGQIYGQGVRCVGGALKRLFAKSASGGSITVPDLGGGEPTVSARSAAKGNVILAGQSRWYLVFYRDPFVLGGCSVSSTFNATQTGRVSWSP